MKSSDVSAAVADLQVRPAVVCSSISVILPILKHIKSNAGLRFWVSLGLGMAIGVLEGYQRENCV